MSPGLWPTSDVDISLGVVYELCNMREFFATSSMPVAISTALANSLSATSSERTRCWVCRLGDPVVLCPNRHKTLSELSVISTSLCKPTLFLLELGHSSGTWSIPLWRGASVCRGASCDRYISEWLILSAASANKLQRTVWVFVLGNTVLYFPTWLCWPPRRTALCPRRLRPN